MRLGARVAMIVLLVARTSAAAPPDADTCSAAYESTQRLRREGKLREAEEQSMTCASQSCAAWIRKECGVWLDEIREAMPTLTVSAVGPDGCDLTRARVLVDGALVAEQLDGRAVPLDPGKHVVRVEVEGQTPNERELLLTEAQKAKRHVVRFAPEGVTCGAPPKPIDAPPAERPSRSALPFVIGGIGIAALAVGAGFEIAGLSQKSTLDGCRPRCATDDVDGMRTKFLVGDGLVGAGVVFLAVATVLYFTGGPVRAARSSALR